MTEKIPSPRGYPLIGNILDIDPSYPLASLSRLASIHGPLMRLHMPQEILFASSYGVAKDLCDEQRFQKAVVGPLEEVRNLGGDGLFTAHNGEHNWELAHRLLMPAFGPLPIKSMFPEMQDIVSQMVLKWARFGPDRAIDVPDDFTRLTLDSIAICAMGDRFNSFYQEDQHSFVHAMMGVLDQSLARTRRLPLPSSFYAKQDQNFRVDIEKCQSTARDLLEARRARPNDKKDLLNAMINAKDPKTGEKLSDESIINNMVTFLVAGHETTSGLLSFLFYALLENPQAYTKLQEEIDTVIGKAPVTFEHMSKLPYLEACLRETLRLYPTAPALILTAKGDQIVGDGRWMIKGGENIILLLDKMHRDPEVYGQNVEAFRPERMYKEAFHALPPNAWKPFGNGTRGCIGRPFAWQEAILATATLLQTFHFTKADPSYRLAITMTLTIKPKGFFMKAKLRDPHFIDRAATLGAAVEPQASDRQTTRRQSKVDDKVKLRPMKILYGSNTGTCEALAQSLASSAPEYGFTATVSSMDDGVSALDKDVPVVVFTASYEGLPPDNAGQFVQWISSDKKPDLEGVAFAVFGVGNKEWVHTYQKIPTLVDEALANSGGKRLVDREETDVQADQIFNNFDDWQENKLWPTLKQQFDTQASGDAGSGAKALSMTIDTQSRSSMLRQDTQLGEVAETSLLTGPGMSRKRHIGIRLPSGSTYRAGDYLAVLPLNPPSLVNRVQKRFALPWDAVITIDASNVTSLPKGHPVSAHDVLSSMVELEQPASSRVATAVAKSIPDQNEARALEERLAKGISVPLLELLEDHPQAQFSLAQFLAALPPMRMRQYSISSSPLQNPTVATLTYAVLDEPNRSGSTQNFVGVCTTYMERLSVGDRVHVSLKSSRSGFHLPADDSTAIVMACAGTGLAPFRAFVAERAIKKAAGANVGPTLLFYGCKQPDGDDMYRAEFDAWEGQGVVSVRRAFSSKPGDSGGARHVQERIWNDREEVAQLYRQNAHLYLCGAGMVGSGVEEVMARIRAEAIGEDLATAKKWVAELKGERYWSDVFS